MESGFYSPRTDAFPAGLRVLVVDDDPTWLKILEKMLRKCSYEGQFASLFLGFLLSECLLLFVAWLSKRMIVDFGCVWSVCAFGC